MSKHNYSQYSNKNNTQQNNNQRRNNPPKPTSVEPAKPVNIVEETVETKTLPETVAGMVIGCAKLNVRSDASLFADVVCTLDVMSEIMINVNKSTKDWFYVCTATGIEGYCMRKFVEAHL